MSHTAARAALRALTVLAYGLTIGACLALWFAPLLAPGLGSGALGHILFAALLLAAVTFAGMMAWARLDDGAAVDLPDWEHER